LKKPVRVLIADDHALVREGIRKILSVEPEIEVVGEVTDGDEAIKFAREHQVDIILMDINMPKINGITACKVIKEEYPDVAVIALTIHDQEEYLFEMINAGISGYVLKDISPDKLVSTILDASEGKSFIPPSLTSRVLEEFKRLYTSQKEQNKSPVNELTDRELEVLQLVAAGDSNDVIAKKLYISTKTVKNHLTNIFQKLGVSDRTQAAILAIKNGIAAPLDQGPKKK